ncbi:MAG: DUF3656 domain-containing protein [Methanomicrobiales archaeon]|nr:DUF3656 domain-containing protein [Methanomicrobiales archaeon]
MEKSVAHPSPCRKRDAGRILPELLAPAGSMEAFHAAIAAGADAVYVGGKRFSARMQARNFDLSELQQVVAEGHAAGCRVYVTLNTLITDAELPDALEYAIALYAMGVDGILVQDPGLAVCARTIMPRMPLHASTQLSIHHSAGVAWARNHGFARVVLAREMTLDEITAIGQNLPGIGLEVFIHGALCYSYSGQCLLSSLIGGRSGNRGMCAQPCRKPYHIICGGQDSRDRTNRPIISVSADGDYLLSTRDLAVYSCLDQILGAPLTALKIEGRMRSADYVAVVVDIYRKAMDAIADNAWVPSEEDLRDLALAFNRDFTTGYISGRSAGDVMGRQRADNRGIPLGVIRSCDPARGTAVVAPYEDRVPSIGDGIEILPRDGGTGFGGAVCSTPIRVPGGYRIRVNRHCSPGDRVQLTRSAGLESRILGILARRKERRTPIDLDLILTGDRFPVLSGKFCSLDGKNVTVSCTADFYLTPGRTSPLTRERIRTQLAKSGDTPFTVRKFSIHYPGGLFAPLAALNGFRREFFRKAAQDLQAANRPREEDIIRCREKGKTVLARLAAGPEPGDYATIPMLACYTGTQDGAKEAVAAGCRRIYFEPSVDMTADRKNPGTLMQLLKEGGNIAKSTGAEIFWKWPRITRPAFLAIASRILPDLPRTGISGIMVESAGLGEMIHAMNPALVVTGGAGLNVTNHGTACALCPPLRGVTLSPELSGREMQGLAARIRSQRIPLALEVLVQGNLEAVNSEDALFALATGKSGTRLARGFWGIRDETGRVFPLSRDCMGKTRIANAVELCLVDHVLFFSRIGISILTIDARERTPDYVKATISSYRQAVSVATESPEEWDMRLPGIKEELKGRSRGGITQGHFPTDFGGCE